MQSIGGVLLRILAVLAGAAAAFGLADGERYQVKLAMSEAVTNAIQHGSSSPDDSITICCREEEGALAFYVKDTGQFKEQTNSFGGEDTLAEGGRGLEFMRRLMDDVQISPSPDGTLLRFAKRPT